MGLTRRGRRFSIAAPSGAGAPLVDDANGQRVPLRKHDGTTVGYIGWSEAASSVGVWVGGAPPDFGADPMVLLGADGSVYVQNATDSGDLSIAANGHVTFHGVDLNLAIGAHNLRLRDSDGLTLDGNAVGTSGPTGYFAKIGDYTANVLTEDGTANGVPLSLFVTTLSDTGSIAHLAPVVNGYYDHVADQFFDGAALVFDKPGKFFVRLSGEPSAYDAGITTQELMLDQSPFTPQKNELPFASAPGATKWLADGAIAYIEEADVGIPTQIKVRIVGANGSFDWVGIWVDELYPPE